MYFKKLTKIGAFLALTITVSLGADRSRGAFPLNILSADVLEIVTSYLPPHSLRALWTTGDGQLQIRLRQTQSIDISVPPECDYTPPITTREVTGIIQRFPWLRSLNVSGRIFSRGILPAHLTQLVKLKELSASNCVSSSLTILPNTLTGLSNLQKLNLSTNRFQNDLIPDGFRSLLFLNALDISDCDLRLTPDNIANLPPYLTALDLSNNQDMEEFLTTQRVFPSLTKLNLSIEDHSIEPHFFNATFTEENVSKLIGLTDLNIFGHRLKGKQLAVLASLSNLTDLMCWVDDDALSDEAANTLTKLPKLSTLYLTSLCWGGDIVIPHHIKTFYPCGSMEYLPGDYRLEVLTLVNGDADGFGNLIAWIELDSRIKFPQLTTLNMINEIEGDNIGQLPDWAPTLTELNLDLSPERDCVSQVLSQVSILSQLQKLSLAASGAIDYLPGTNECVLDAFDHLTTSLVNLTHLSLDRFIFSERINNSKLILLLVNFPHLTDLSLCDFVVREADLMDLPALTTLRLSLNHLRDDQETIFDIGHFLALPKALSRLYVDRSFFDSRYPMIVNESLLALKEVFGRYNLQHVYVDHDYFSVNTLPSAKRLSGTSASDLPGALALKKRKFKKDDRGE